MFKYKKIHPDAKINMPSKPGDAGYDICSVEEKEILPGEPQIVRTGLIFELPEGHYATIRTRSGHGIKENLRVHPGLADNAYRGEIFLKVYNLGKTPYVVKKGEKIAQIVLNKSIIFDLQEVQEVSSTERGTSGLGSTGKI